MPLTAEQLDRIISEYYDMLGSASDDCIYGILDTIASLEDMRHDYEQPDRPN